MESVSTLVSEGGKSTAEITRTRTSPVPTSRPMPSCNSRGNSGRDDPRGRRKRARRRIECKPRDIHTNPREEETEREGNIKQTDNISQHDREKREGRGYTVERKKTHHLVNTIVDDDVQPLVHITVFLDLADGKRFRHLPCLGPTGYHTPVYG